jgi:ABC-2 type transport system ATP-binding protein
LDSPACIETLELTKRFRRRKGIRGLLSPWEGEEVVAVDRVTLAVRRGELFGLLGPNGAGKTTLLKLLCTLIVPDGGEALVNGYPLSDDEGVRRQIGLVTGEERSFYWCLTGEENLRFYGLLYGLSRNAAEGRIGQLSELLRLGEVLSQRFDTYSAGMKQRLALARGLLNEAEILFLDEPTKSLDPGAALRLREAIRELCRQRGHTVVLVTHQLSEAEQMCDRIGIMHRGRLTAVDEVGHLKDLVRPETRYRLHVTGLPQDFLSRLGLLEGVVDLAIEPGVPEEAVLQLRVEEDRSSLSDVLRTIVENGGEIERIRAEDVTLAEIFAELTSDRSSVPEREAQPCPRSLHLGGICDPRGLWFLRRRALGATCVRV